MPNFSQSFTAPKMGRPPLKGELTSVRLTEGAKTRITALVGTYGMARFIREAVDAAIEAREREAAAGTAPKPKTKPKPPPSSLKGEG